MKPSHCFAILFSIPAFAFSAEKAPSPLATELFEVICKPNVEDRMRGSISVLDRAKPEDMDALLWAFDECARLAIKPDFTPTFYWRKRAGAEGPALLDRLVGGDWNERGIRSGVTEAAISGALMSQREPTIEWLHKHKEHSQFRSYLIAAVGALGVESPADGTKLLYELTDGGKSKLFADACGAMCERIRNRFGTPYLIEWFDALSAEQKPPAFIHAASRIREAEFPIAAKWLASQISKDWYTTETPVWQFAESYVRAKPEEALNWVASLPDQKGKDYPTGMGAAMEMWATNDAIAAGKWLQTHMETKGWVRAAAAYYRGVRRKSANDAQLFLDALPKPLREKVEDMVENW